MKKLSKILALVVALTMLMSVSAFAATKTLVTGTNGKTIDLSFAFTDTSANPITEVASGSTFIIQVNFAGNSGDPDDTANLGMCGYNILVKYDTAKVQFTNKQAGIQVTANPTANATFAEGIAYYTAAFESGALNDSEWVIYEEGNLFRIRAKALADLKEADLAGLVEFVASATNTAGTLTNETKVLDQDTAGYTITVPVAEDPKPVNKPVTPSTVVTTLEAADANYTNVAIWKATFSNLETLGATQIGYDFTKEGSSKNNGKVITTTINGDGAVEFVLALYGVPAADVADLTFNPYYTVME